MTKPLRLIPVSGTVLGGVAVVDLAFAQSAPPPPSGPAGAGRPAMPPHPPAVVSDLQQLPETRGVVQRFSLTPRGELDGFLLADGAQVHLPPHLSADLAAAVHPGDAVSVRGYRLPTAPLIVAVAVTNTATNLSVVDRGPPAPGLAPPPPPGAPSPGAQETTLTGKIQSPLYGPEGDLNGAVTEEGVIVRLPPPTAYRYARLLAPGNAVTIRGWALTTAYGEVIEAEEISPTGIVGPTPER